MEKGANIKFKKNIVFCPSAVPYKDMTIDSVMYPGHYRDTVFKGFHDEMETKARDTHGVIKILWEMQEGQVPGIPEVDRFKWQECCLAKIGGDKEDEKLAKEKYRQLANLLSRYN